MNDSKKADVMVYKEGYHFLFQPMTEAGTAWIEENVSEPMWSGVYLFVEGRYARDLAAGMLSDGLKVE